MPTGHMGPAGKCGGCFEVAVESYDDPNGYIARWIKVTVLRSAKFGQHGVYDL